MKPYFYQDTLVLQNLQTLTEWTLCARDIYSKASVVIQKMHEVVFSSIVPMIYAFQKVVYTYKFITTKCTQMCNATYYKYL